VCSSSRIKSLTLPGLDLHREVVANRSNADEVPAVASTKKGSSFNQQLSP
jgi:hypothetical protein